MLETQASFVKVGCLSGRSVVGFSNPAGGNRLDLAEWQPDWNVAESERIATA